MHGRLDTYWAKAGKIWAAQNIKREHGKTRTARRVEVAAFMADIVKDLDEPKILEVGCNYGENLACLREVLPKAQLFGIDISDDSINVARQRNQGADYLTSSVYDLPYKEGEFDMVFTMGVMIHLHPSDIKHAIGSVAKLSNRHIIHTEVATQEMYGRCGKLTNPNTAEYGPRRPYLFLHDYEELYKRTWFSLKSQFLTVDALVTMHFEK